MAAQQFSEKHRVVYYEGDDTGHLTVAMLINLFVLVSKDQSDALGWTSDRVHGLGVGWVVTQYHIQIDRLPVVNEAVTVKTRATAYNRYFAYREYWLVDQDGNQLAYGEGIWVTMSYATRKIATIPTELMGPYESELVSRIPRLPRPSRLDHSLSAQLKPYTVRYFDIDGNGHVNNAHYFDWMLDTLPADWLRQHQARDIRIRFENEVQYGHQVLSTAVMSSAHATTHEVKVGATVAVQAAINWQDR